MLAKIKTISLKKNQFEPFPICGSYLKFKYSGTPHEFKSLNGNLKTLQNIYECENGHIYTPLNPYVFPYKNSVSMYILMQSILGLIRIEQQGKLKKIFGRIMGSR